MTTRAPHRTCLVIALVACLIAGCSGDQDVSVSSPEQGSARTKKSLPAPAHGKLGQLALALENGHGADLVSPDALPPKAIEGLRIGQPGGGDGFIYRYRSTNAAKASLLSLLELKIDADGPRPPGGVTGCGSFAWLTISADSDDWESAVRRQLEAIDSACGGGRGFGIVS